MKRLIYELKLSLKWNVHLVIFITQLKFHFATNDFYDKKRFDHFETVKVNEMSNTNWKKNYEIKKIMNRRLKVFDRKFILQYLIKWKRYDVEFDEWKTLSFLKKCLKLIKNYERKHS